MSHSGLQYSCGNVAVGQTKCGRGAVGLGLRLNKKFLALPFGRHFYGDLWGSLSHAVAKHNRLSVAVASSTAFGIIHSEAGKSALLPGTFGSAPSPTLEVFY
jgi:hypothetical protein